MKMKLSDYVWKFIEELGVRHVFMFPGGGAMHLVDSLGKNKKLDYITLLHEQACVMAAETYSRIDYTMGAALVTTGPGGTNAVTGVAAAWLESTPLIVISGQAKTADLKKESGVRQKGNQEIGIVDIVKSITKYAVMIENANEIKMHLEKAVFEARNGRPGPVWIDIPLDIQAEMIDTEQLESFQYDDFLKENKDIPYISECLELLVKAKKPVLIAGQGIERKKGKQIFRELVEYLKIPVLTSWIATELLEFDNPYSLGKPGMVAGRYSNYTMQEADLVLAIGTRLDPAMIGYNPQDFAPNAEKVIVDIDQHELDKFQFDIKYKIQADATTYITSLLNECKRNKIEFVETKWLRDCQKMKLKYPILLPEYGEQKKNVNPYFFINMLSDKLADDEVVIPGSSGAGIDVFWLCFKNRREQRTLATGSLGSMGYGIPAAIGACIASGKRTICIEGDGSIQLNIQEFASIRGMNLPIKIFVLNNEGYVSIMNMQKNHFNGNFVGANEDSHLFLPNIISVAKAYGFNTFEITSHTDMENTIHKVLTTEGPVLCNVQMNSQLTIQPKVMSWVDENGKMHSGSLTKLWPFLEEE